jgi:glycolate oxidase iron-sulfur subunit
MKSVEEEGAPIGRLFVDEMYFCLDCQACETVCPAGVRYGELVEHARELMAENGKDAFALRILKRVFLRGVLNSRHRLKFAAALLRAYERSGLRDAVEQSSILTVFSERLHEKHLLLPRFSDGAFTEEIQEILPSADDVERRGRVAFLSGCIMNYALPHVHRAAVAVLRAAGFEVIIPRAQECCGSLHAHSGDMESARRLARKNVDVFSSFDFDALVVDSAGCGAFLKQYGEILSDDPAYAERARFFSQKVRDITEFLAGVPLPNLSPIDKRVTYHEACHLVHTQKVSREPRELIRRVPGIELAELPESTWCCGSAGIYNILRYDDSIELLERKIRNIAATGADIVLTANPGCHIQLEYGLRKFGVGAKVMHPVELLAAAIQHSDMVR